MTRDQNRSRFSAGAEFKDWADLHFPCTPNTRGNSIPFAENNDGEFIGERFEDRCKREGHVPCTYWRNGVR